MGPQSNDKCPYESEEKTQARGMKMEAEVGVMQPEAKECLEPPKAGRDLGLSHWAFTESTALEMPDIKLVASRTVRETITVVLSHLGCGNSLGQPWATNTLG